MKQVGNLTDKRIWVTRDYDAFKKLKGNRGVDKARKARIVESIKTFGYHTSPILVNEKMEVVDGQGRLAALKDLNLPVEYVVEPGIGIGECRAMNTSSTNWKITDFIKSYAEDGWKDYITLQNAINQYSELPLACINYAFTGNIALDERIKQGKFSTDARKTTYAGRILKYMEKFASLKGKVNGQSYLFFIVVGFAYDLEEVDREKLLRICLKHTDKTSVDCSNKEKAFSSVGALYNRWSRQKDNIYLHEAYQKALEGRLPWYSSRWGNKKEQNA